MLTFWCASTDDVCCRIFFLATWERNCLRGGSLVPPNCIISFSKGVHCVALFSLKNTMSVNGFEFDLVYGYKVK